jgi:hypothetical protein
MHLILLVWGLIASISPMLVSAGVSLWHGGLSSWSVSSTSHRVFSVSVKIKHISQELAWWLTTVYGQSVEDQKATFLNGLNDLR